MGETMSHRWAARTAIAGTCLIAFGAFWLSFTALADLATRSGIAAGQAWAWPLIVDGIIVVATVSVVALAGQKTAWYPWMLLAGGALISVTANAVHAVVSADADVLLAINHLTVILTRKPADTTAEAPRLEVHQIPVLNSIPELVSAEGPMELVPVAPVEGDPATVESVADRREQAVGLREAGWSNKQIARQLGVHASTVGRWFAREHPPIDTESETTGDES